MGDLLLYCTAVLSRILGRKIVDQCSDLGGRYWDRTSDLFGVKQLRRHGDRRTAVPPALLIRP